MKTVSAEIRAYTPALAFDAILPRKQRTFLMRILSIILFILAGILCFYVVKDTISVGALAYTSILGDAHALTGAFCIIAGIYGVLVLLTLYYNTFYFRGLSTVYGEDLAEGEGVTHEFALVCGANEDDLTSAFLTSSYGNEIMIRSGVPHGDVETFLQGTRPRIGTSALTLTLGHFLTLQDLGEYIFANDSQFKDFLFRHGVTPALFSGANEWVWRVRAVYKKRQRWWSKDNLGTKNGIGRELSYGSAYNMKRFQRDINTTSAFSVFLSNTAYANEVIEHIEATLIRTKAANVMLIGEPGVGKMDILIEFARRIREGHSIASLSAKRIVVFDTDLFVATYSSKADFEPAFLNLMLQTERAGNVVVVIENFTSFLDSVSALEVNAADLLGRFLTSRDVQIVATVDPQSYHATLEANQQLLQYFEPVLIEVPDLSSTVRVLEESSWTHEHTFNLYFTYPAIVRIAECADQYIVEGVMPDKAVSLLAEVAARAGQDKQTIVDAEFVDIAVSEKTGIPAGPVRDAERDKLMHLEEVLHKRVVGQERAISVIANAMRRARAGIQGRDKPIGTFLFLGSTGVGKTETAKALAYTFFGSEEHMMRFDMSEFSGADGLTRLIGSQEAGGALSSTLREHPYGVLLLDEFEKSDGAVRDLFLQVFDEGIFTDAHGQKVNARNTIIIATSNAGSDLIWKFVQEGKTPEDEKETIINTIIERKIYRPELLNRFDAVVLFEMLGEEEQRTIAGFMLSELVKRIKDKGYELVVDDVLIDVLMKEGYDPQFGARPMRRAIQDIIEERVARKILEGGLRVGDTIRFTPEDFA